MTTHHIKVDGDLNRDLRALCEPGSDNEDRENEDYRFILTQPKPLERLSAVEWAILVMPPD